jgi:HEAT repeat protein
MTLEADEATLDRQAVRLRKLAGSPAPEARLAAVQALVRARDLDNVPTLIYALSDPDPEIVATALEGLRFVSRKFEGLGGSSIRDEASRNAAIDRWKSWYLSVRPEATFERD